MHCNSKFDTNKNKNGYKRASMAFDKSSRGRRHDVLLLIDFVLQDVFSEERDYYISIERKKKTTAELNCWTTALLSTHSEVKHDH